MDGTTHAIQVRPERRLIHILQIGQYEDRDIRDALREERAQPMMSVEKVAVSVRAKHDGNDAPPKHSLHAAIASLAPVTPFFGDFAIAHGHLRRMEIADLSVRGNGKGDPVRTRCERASPLTRVGAD